MRPGRIQWFDVEDRTEPMGVKCVGTFCERLADAGWVDPAGYVVGMQVIPGEIPSLGRFESACDAVGGFTDGCHRLAAAATIPGGAAEAFPRAFARAAGEG